MRLFLLWTLFSITGLGCAKEYIEPEIYLVPEGYIGELYIVYGVEEGQPERFSEDGERLFEFDETGVLLTQFSGDNPGYVNHDVRKFFYDKKNKWLRIPLIFGIIEKTEETIADPTIYAQISGLGSHSKGWDIPCEYTYRTFYIGNAKQTYDGEGDFDIFDYYDKYGFPCGNKLYFNDKPPIDIKP